MADEGDPKPGDGKKVEAEKTTEQPKPRRRLFGAAQDGGPNWAECVIAGATCVYAFFACAQWYELRSTVAETAKSLRLDQRAWIGVEKIDPKAPPVVGKPASISVTFKNTGKTPARNIVSVAVVDPVTTGKPDFSYTEKHLQLGTMQPSGEAFIKVTATQSRSTGKDAPLTEPLLEALKSGSIRLYVHGEITYEDIFRRPHLMTFCYFLLEPELNSYAACPEHNDTDEYQE
jgi:hypothetical protein